MFPEAERGVSVPWRNGLPDQRLLKRYARRFTPNVAALDRLAEAIHALLHGGGVGDPFFLSKSLEMLANHLGASQATLVMVTAESAETRWWHPEREEEQPPEAISSFCTWLMEHPERTLVVKEMQTGPHARNPADVKGIPHQAALG